MANNKGKRPQTTRIPADELLINFLKQNNIVIIVDEAGIVQNTVKGLVYTVDKRPRVRVYYKDQIEKENPTKDIEIKPEINVAN